MAIGDGAAGAGWLPYGAERMYAVLNKTQKCVLAVEAHWERFGVLPKLTGIVRQVETVERRRLGLGAGAPLPRALMVNLETASNAGRVVEARVSGAGIGGGR